MNDPISRFNKETILAALSVEAMDVTPHGNSAWRLTWHNGTPYAVTARTDGEWLCFDAEYVRHAVKGDLWWDARIPQISKARRQRSASAPSSPDAVLRRWMPRRWRASMTR